MPSQRYSTPTSSIVFLIGTIAATSALSGCVPKDSNGTPFGTSATAGSGNGSAGNGSAGNGNQPSQPATETQTDPGSIVTPTPKASESAEAERLQGQLAELDGLSGTGFLARYPSAFSAAPSYDSASVAGLDKIQASSLKLDAGELQQLQAHGFAISATHQLPSFAYGYSTIYLEDLPVYVSADSILNAVHRSYDTILERLEQGLLSQELSQLLTGMQQKLAMGTGKATDANAAADADVFVAVARSLLSGKLVKPVAGGSASKVQELVALAQAGSGTADVQLFGVLRKDEDFSQFTPRSHYLDTPELSQYFRCMIWLGRIDLRLLETQPDGTQLFRRRQLEISLILRELVGSDLRAHFDRVDRTIAAFVGEPDYMVLSELDQLLTDLGISSSAELATFSDQQLAQAIIDGGYGAQRISSHIMIAGPHPGQTLPLSRSFALLGQRYVLDSHVFSNVVYDRVSGDPMRMMPNPLDAGFAALANDQAATLLAPELTKYEAAGYPGALAQMRVLADEHPSDYWNQSLYTLWLGALRTLSPSGTSAGADAQSLFPVARTEAWGRRLLSSQLASWAELRHDTILYVKQSYTGGATCDFPDAYVDPYPEFYAAISAYATRGSALVDALDLGSAGGPVIDAVKAHFALVAEVADKLRSIAENERTGAALTADMLAFINDAVVVQHDHSGCVDVPTFAAGWYKKLFIEPTTALEAAPTIADVHTQPTDEAGAPVGKVLHVGTGTPRVMVVVSEGCSGPRAYAGLVSSYREKITDNFKRLDDDTWTGMLASEPEVPWMKDLVGAAAP